VWTGGNTNGWDWNGIEWVTSIENNLFPPPPPPPLVPQPEWGAGFRNGSAYYTLEETVPPLEITVTFSEPYIIYPDVFYLAAQPFYTRVFFRTTISQVFGDDVLQVTITDGNPNDGVVSSGEREVSILIPRGKTRGPEIDINGNTEPQRIFDGGCSARQLSLVPPSSPVRIRGASVPGGPAPTPVRVNLTGEPQDYSICAYATQLSWGLVGHWRRIGGQWEWDTDSAEAPPQPSGWLWNEGLQQWAATAPQDDWTWSGTAWTYTGSDPTKPNRPANPPAIPTTTPPGTGEEYVSFTFTVASSKMPVMDDLVIELGSTIETDAAVITIPRVIPIIGGWRWVAATEDWERRDISPDWRWHSQIKAWQIIGAQEERWQFNMTTQLPEYVGTAYAGWEWNGTAWIWTAGGAPDTPIGGLPAPPAGPPTQGGSIYPPDLATWTWNGTAWTGGSYAAESRPPVGPWEGSTVIHVFAPPVPPP
jgi:hypothetical protein